jgi:LDH2 family malate/lactate/ureidoglycolate dehydrogenase
MDVLSGVLTGSSYATDVVGPYVPDQRSGCGHLVLALRVDAIIPESDFGERIDDLIAITKSVPRAAGTEEIFYPGEIEARAEATGRLAGVRLPDKTVAALRELGTTCGVPLDDSMLDEEAS